MRDDDPNDDCFRRKSHHRSSRCLNRPLSVSNCLSGGDWEPDEVPAVRDPAHMVQIDRDHRVPTGEGVVSHSSAERHHAARSE